MSRGIEIGTKLKVIREKRELSQIELVEKLTEKNINMSRETLSKIENNNRTISAIELNALCNILDIDMKIFFDDEEADDLVTLFRKRNFSENTIKEIEKLQDMIKVFIYQKKIYKGEFRPRKNKPLWEEC